MLQEAISYLVRLGRESHEPIVTAGAEPGHVYFVRKPDGTLEKRTAAPALAKNTADSLATIAALAATELDDIGTVWFSAGRVVLRYGINGAETTTLVLVPSDQMKQLAEWHRAKPYLTQVELIRVLRTTFRDCLASNPSLVDVLKKVKFNTQSQINSEVGHGRASVGKELMGEVTGTGAIPEYVRFSVPLFANPCLRSVRANVECALDPNAATGQFQVLPLPGQIEDAQDVGTTAVGAILRDTLPKDYPLYHGTPGA